MNLGELKQYIERVEKDLSKVEEEVDYQRKEIMPKLIDRIDKVNYIILPAIGLGSINLLFMGFVIYKVFDLSNQVAKLIK